MLKKLAAAALMASLVPAAAFACEGMAASQTAVAPVVAAKKQAMIAQLDMKELQKAGDNAGKSIKKDADKTNLNANLQQASNDVQGTTKSTSSKSAVKPRPKAKQLSTPKAK
jgi:hypothetical protein